MTEKYIGSPQDAIEITGHLIRESHRLLDNLPETRGSDRLRERVMTVDEILGVNRLIVAVNSGFVVRRK